MTTRTRPVPPVQTRAESTRARLLEAAVDAFSAKGFHGTTTRDIATAAHMSPAALYVHHRSKEELLYLISKSGHEHIVELVLGSRAASPDPIEQLRTFAREFALHHARDHVRSRVVNYEMSALSAEHLAEITRMRQRIDHEVRDLVYEGAEAGVFDVPDARMAAAALLSLGIDLSRWYRLGGAWTPEEISESYVALALRIVGVVEQ